MRGRNQALKDTSIAPSSDRLAAETDKLKLLDHQKQGIFWLVESWKNGQNVMLADEMGLGKTIQAIGLIKELLFTYKVTRPFLISVPLSTIENWRREFKLWCPEARIVTYLGCSKSRQILRDLDFSFPLKSTTTP
mmetsp:Transcript_32893/g.43356  ORF Transcript_32893/g.43356 Transcript_32893/m.43356 type:complete len:135 (-) Transcript_32893:2874-3278(-)